MEANQKIYIIGIGDDGLEGLTAAARALVAQADVMLGSRHTLVAAPDSRAQQVEVGGDLDAAVQFIALNPGKRIVVLMAGDPLFFGAARFLCDRLGQERFEVVPHVSSMQLAFARVKQSWDEAYLANVATQGLDRVVEQIRTVEKAGLFTSEELPPSAVARELLARRIDYFAVYVCENLGSPDERVTRGSLAEVAEQEFSPLNVLILVRQPDRPDQPSQCRRRRLFGNPDEAFLQSRPKRGLVTPAEVRSIALAEMCLATDSLVWDVGAGSGAVAIEAAQIASQGVVYAIERDVEDCQLIAANAEAFGVRNLKPVLGKAPEAWADLPDPDAIFVGGAGRQVGGIVEAAFARLRPGGQLVATVRSIENVAAVRAVLHRQTDDDQVWLINLARGVYQLERVRFESLSPTFLIGARKRA